MATANVTATDVSAKEDTLTLRGDLGAFPNLADEGVERTWLMTNVKYSDFRKFLTINLFSPSNNTGEQRPEKKEHVIKLKKAAEANKYTPSTLSAGLYETHRECILIDRSRKKVTLTLTADNKIPVISGSAQCTTPATSPSVIRRIEQPVLRTSSISLAWRGRSMISVEISLGFTPLALASALMLSAGDASRSMTPGA